MRPLLLGGLLLLGCATTSPAPSRGETVVVVVRHAEKAPEPKADPPLTEAGQARAQQLVEAVAGLRFTAALSTNFERTRATAEPLAARFGLTLKPVDVKGSDVAALVLQQHRGETVLVVGHSNTVPDIVAGLGAAKPLPICEAEFDRLFVVRVPASGEATVEERRYGARTDDHGCRAQ